MLTLMAKEFKWNFRSFRYPAFFLVLLFFALMNPPTTKYMQEILAYFAEGMAINLPDPTPEAAFISYLQDVSQIGVFALIFIIMGSVAKEKENGVTGWILSKPVGKRKYLGAKIIVHYLAVIMVILGTSTLSYLYTWSLLGQVSLIGALWSTISLMVFALFIASITFTLSVLLKTPLQAGGVAIMIYFITSLLNMLIANSAISKFYPNTLLEQMVNLVTAVSTPGDIAVTLVTTLGLSLFILVLGGLKFARMEI